MTAPQMTRLPGDPSPATLRFIWKLAHFLVFVTIAVNVVFGAVSYKAHTSGGTSVETIPAVQPESPPSASPKETSHAATEEVAAPPAKLSFWDKIRRGPYEYSWQVMLAHFVGGRAASVGIGLKLGFGRKYLFFLNVMLDLILVLYLYPLFVTGYRHLNRVPFLGSALDSTNELAYKYKDKIAPYGAFGITLFVLFPLWSTGPLVGALLGYIIGLRTWITLFATQFGNCIAVAIWIEFYNWLNGFSGQLAFMLLILIFVMAFIGFVYKRTRENGKKKIVVEIEATAEETAHEVAGMLEPVLRRRETVTVTYREEEAPTAEQESEETPVETPVEMLVETPVETLVEIAPESTAVEEEIIEIAPWAEGEPPPDPDGEGDFFAEKPR